MQQILKEIEKKKIVSFSYVVCIWYLFCNNISISTARCIENNATILFWFIHKIRCLANAFYIYETNLCILYMLCHVLFCLMFVQLTGWEDGT